MTAATESHAEPHAEGHEHPSDLHYFKIAGILAALTAIEVAGSYMGLSTTALILLLMPIMVLKFGLVAAYFMHLKGQSRLFTRLFLTGIVLAAGVYAIVLFAFDEFF